MSSTLFRHPRYGIADYQKWRLAYEGGRNFINTYLQRYSLREDAEDFACRKAVTYCPAFAKASIIEVKNSIYQRMDEVSRVGGSDSYKMRIAGRMGGVDGRGNSLTSFMGQVVLPELLVLGKVGVYVDMPALQHASKRQVHDISPYVYMYPIENVTNWTDDYSQVYLQDTVWDYDDDGFAIGTKSAYRKLWIDSGKVKATIYDEKGDETDEVILHGLTTIPFTMLELSDSLMVDIADYQIALLNIASSDLAYTMRANFPFYVEQYSSRSAGSQHLNHANETTTGEEEIKVGTTHGRRYSENLDAPSFIHPSSEPLKASMSKQQQLKEEIRQLLNLNIQNTKSVGNASADSKKQDELTLESGLANIGLTLERAEREMARIWSEYEGNTTVATVSYPENYSLKSTSDRLGEADKYRELLPVLPSKSYQQEVGLKVARTLLGNTVSVERMNEIEREIYAAPAMIADPRVISQDVQDGICSPETAGTIKCYPVDEHIKAEAAHVKRLERIAIAQSSAAINTTPTSKDQEVDGEFKDQKAASQNTDTSETTAPKTRGEAK